MHRDIGDADVDTVIQAFHDIADQAVDTATTNAIMISDVSRAINPISSHTTATKSSTVGVDGTSGTKDRIADLVVSPRPTIQNEGGIRRDSMNDKPALASAATLSRTATTSTASSEVSSLHTSATTGSTGSSAKSALIDAQSTIIIDARRSTKNQDITQSPSQSPPLDIHIEEKRAKEWNDGWQNQDSSDADDSVEFVVPGELSPLSYPYIYKINIYIIYMYYPISSVIPCNC